MVGDVRGAYEELS